MRLGLHSAALAAPTFVFVSFALASCADPSSEATVEQGRPRDAGTAVDPPVVDDDPPPGDDPDGGPLRKVPGSLLASGRIEIGGVTDDGYVGYLYNPQDEDFSRTEWAAKVLDTKTNVSNEIAKRSSGQDMIVAKGKALALWTARRSPYGWGDLTLWTKAHGVTKAPKNANSLPLLEFDANGSRLAFSYGPVGPVPAFTNIAVSGPTFVPPPAIVAPQVGGGCPVQMTFAGSRLFVGSCEGSTTTATVRSVSDTNQVSTIRSGARSTFSVDAAGSRILVLGSGGDAGVHALPANTVTALESGVVSGVLSLDGTEVVYTTEGGALKRAATTAPVAPTELVGSGAREIVLTSADRSHALVAANAADTQGKVPRYDLRIVSLTAAAPASTLVATSTASPVRFTRSGAHVLYLTDIPVDGLDDMKLRAAPVAGGPEIVLGPNPRQIMEPVGSTKLVWLERRPDYHYDVKVADLENGGGPQLVIDDVTTAVAHGSRLYFTVKDQGLYVMDLP